MLTTWQAERTRRLAIDRDQQNTRKPQESAQACQPLMRRSRIAGASKRRSTKRWRPSGDGRDSLQRHPELRPWLDPIHAPPVAASTQPPHVTPPPPRPVSPFPVPWCVRWPPSTRPRLPSPSQSSATSRQPLVPGRWPRVQGQRLRKPQSPVTCLSAAVHPTELFRRQRVSMKNMRDHRMTKQNLLFSQVSALRQMRPGHRSVLIQATHIWPGCFLVV